MSGHTTNEPRATAVAEARAQPQEGGVRGVPAGAPRRSRVRPAVVALVALLVLVAAGGWWRWRVHEAGVEADVARAAAVRPVTAPGGFMPTDAQRASLQFATIASVPFRAEVTVDGSIAVNEERTTQVLSPFSGRITRLDAAPGDRVSAGAPLFRVWASEAVQAQDDLHNALSALTTATAQLQLAQTTETRQREMLDSKVGSLKDLLQAQSDLVAARGALATAQANLTAVRARLRVLGRSDVDIRRLERDRATAGEATVPAPIDGVVTLRQAGIGQNITSIANGGSMPLFTIADLSTVWLVANVRESDAGRVRAGDTATVQVAALPGMLFEARITWVAPMLDPGTHRLPVRAVVDNPQGLLKPAMLARFTIAQGDAQATPAVPARAVVYEGPDAHVWVVRPDGSLAARKVVVGRAHHDLLQVIDGLAAGDRVVTDGALFIDRAASGDES